MRREKIGPVAIKTLYQSHSGILERLSGRPVIQWSCPFPLSNSLALVSLLGCTVNLFRSLEKVVGCHELFVWTVRSSTHDCPVRLSITDVQCCWPVANLCGLVVQLSGLGLCPCFSRIHQTTATVAAASWKRHLDHHGSAYVACTQMSVRTHKSSANERVGF